MLACLVGAEGESLDLGSGPTGLVHASASAWSRCSKLKPILL